MTRIDFAFGAPDRLRMACQVVRKRYLAGQRLVVYCREGSRLAQFDRMLWAFDDTSFVPHVLANDPLAAETPVVLTAGDPQQAAQAAGDGPSCRSDIISEIPRRTRSSLTRSRTSPCARRCRVRRWGWELRFNKVRINR